MGKFSVVQFAFYTALFFAIVGVLCGILYSFGGLIIDAGVSIGWLSPESWETPGLSKGTILAFGALIGMPWIFAVMGFVAGIVVGIVISPFAGMFGTSK